MFVIIYRSFGTKPKQTRSTQCFVYQHYIFLILFRLTILDQVSEETCKSFCDKQLRES